MEEFGRAALLGLGLGLLWGTGCTLVILYSIYLAGYRKAIKDSLKAQKPARYTQIYEKVLAKRAKAKVKAAAAAQ
ncbi:MAG: hypothetical protein P4K94_08260 [Terracidiphilus sp.]|nr:hypothetical protein [Terracidiphilus sp.]